MTLNVELKTMALLVVLIIISVSVALKAHLIEDAPLNISELVAKQDMQQIQNLEAYCEAQGYKKGYVQSSTQR